MNTILLIRTQSDCETLGTLLERENFRPIRVDDLDREFDEALTRRPQLLLLEHLLDGASIGDVFRRASHTRTPTIVLGSADDEEERSRLLDQGADDYVLRPFSQRELLARIRAVLRRTSKRIEPAVKFGEVEVDVERRAITRNGRRLELSRAEHKLLLFFLQNESRALSREEILDWVWGYQSTNSRTVDMHVALLRGKLEADPKAPRHIVTVRGVGYRFTP